MRTTLPTPSPDDRDRSLALEQKIRQEMAASDDMLTFERYMQLCLYTEGLGYYTSGQAIFGEHGDFVTSSEKSAYFAKAFVGHLVGIQAQLNSFCIVEIGAGSGRFAAQLLTELKRTKLSVINYYIVEKSATLRLRQQEYLAELLPEESQLVKWRETFDEPIASAVVIANEVIDALPVRLVTVNNQTVRERRIQWSAENGFVFVSAKADEGLTNAAHEVLENTPVLNLQQPYESEICMQLPDFIQQIASFVRQGIFFFIDYGYPRSEYYHVQRTMGTLLCHYKNLAHDNPLIWPGLQDISSNVDFTALANAGIQNGLELNCYGTQAHFLLASNILAVIENETATENLLHSSQQLKQLIMPSEMGERFQVMIFTKRITLDQYQFATKDLSHRL